MRFLPIVFASLLLVCCDKPDVTRAEEEEGSEAAPAVTKSARTSRGTALDGRKKVQEALEAAKAISDPVEREKAIAALVWENAETNSKSAQEAFAALDVGSEQRKLLIEHFALGLTGQDVDQAVRWAKTLKTPEEISQAYSSIAVAMADTDPARAATILSQSGQPGRNLDVAVVGVVQRWAATSPADAAGWVQKFEAGEARTAGIKAITGTWAQIDMPATLQWIDGLSNPALHQEAVAGMAEAVMQMPPGIQEDWASQVTPEIRTAFEKLRDQAQKEVETPQP